jgi:hypothetical protein
LTLTGLSEARGSEQRNAVPLRNSLAQTIRFRMIALAMRQRPRLKANIHRWLAGKADRA